MLEKPHHGIVQLLFTEHERYLAQATCSSNMISRNSPKNSRSTVLLSSLFSDEDTEEMCHDFSKETGESAVSEFKPGLSCLNAWMLHDGVVHFYFSHSCSLHHSHNSQTSGRNSTGAARRAVDRKPGVCFPSGAHGILYLAALHVSLNSHSPWTRNKAIHQADRGSTLSINLLTDSPSRFLHASPSPIFYSYSASILIDTPFFILSKA